MKHTECVVALALALTSCTYGPKQLTSSAMLEAMKKATADVETLNAHRLDGLLIYDPLYVEAEKSISALAAASSGKINDQNAVFQARQCADKIQEVRRYVERYHDAELEKSSGTLSDMCVKEMYTYIR